MLWHASRQQGATLKGGKVWLKRGVSNRLVTWTLLALIFASVFSGRWFDCALPLGLPLHRHCPSPIPPQGLMAVLHRMFIVIGASNDALRSYVLRWGLAVLSWQNSCLMTQQLIWLQTLPLWNCWNIPPNLNKEIKSQNIEARIRVNTLQWNHVVVFCAGRVIVCAIIIHSLSLLPNFRMFGKCLGQLRTCSLCCLACVNAFCLSAYVNNPPSYLETVLHSVSMVLLEMWGPLMPNLSSTLLLCLARLNF